MIVAVLVVLGLCFGSFVNALVWRLHKQDKAKAKKQKTKYSIVRGRSQCVDCGHVLSAIDLLPVLSWLAQAGKCRYCKKPISWQYPLVELLTAGLFVFSYIFWPVALVGILPVVSFGLWLALLVGLMALVVYDLRWMLLPNKIVFVLLGVASAFALCQILQADSGRAILDTALGVLVGGGLFFVLFHASSGRWIGGGDVKLGFVLGLVLASPTKAGLMLFLASLLGTLFSLPFMLARKISPTTRIPFGPFLIIATIITLFFGQSLIDWYAETFLGL